MHWRPGRDMLSNAIGGVLQSVGGLDYAAAQGNVLANSLFSLRVSSIILSMLSLCVEIPGYNGVQSGQGTVIECIVRNDYRWASGQFYLLRIFLSAMAGPSDSSHRAMDVLVYLANHAGSVVSANELIRSIWQGRVVGDGTIYQVINQLRKALDNGPQQITYIETISKRGYRLVADVPTTNEPDSESRRERIQSLAVLPLTNLSSDPEQEYFADGMTEVLIANLAKVRAMRVISRTSAMRYKGSSSSIPEIAAELNVDAVLEGSVLREGQKVRITVQLICAATDTHLWAESYERDVRDILLLQSEVAQAVTRNIQVAEKHWPKKVICGASNAGNRNLAMFFQIPAGSSWSTR